MPNSDTLKRISLNLSSWWHFINKRQILYLSQKMKYSDKNLIKPFQCANISSYHMQRQPNQLPTCFRHKGTRTKEPSSKHKSKKIETNPNWQTGEDACSI
mmetsp:Transcript_39790/g.46535  ORF Transcript_39790/g.46535 Transcript_39790/m.46535 type:complete len:100 (+) Transcript_39790:1188-1487(+)